MEDNANGGEVAHFGLRQIHEGPPLGRERQPLKPSSRYLQKEAIRL